MTKRTGLAVLILLVLGMLLPSRELLRAPHAPAADTPARAGEPTSFELEGKTQCVPGRKAIIAPVPLHPVTDVLVVPGDRVKKEQVLVKLDADEPQADVRFKKAQLEAAGIAREEAARTFAVTERSRETLPERRWHEARAALRKAEADERASKAALDSAEAELEHYTLTSPIDGVVAWLDVHVGMVSRPGTTVWGEILDLREIDVRCDLTPEQIDRVALGQVADVRARWRKEPYGTGKVVFIGISADRTSGLVPIVVRLANPQEALRCNVPVQVSLKLSTPAASER
jgi:RND family efflux transporter MFP subunit